MACRRQAGTTLIEILVASTLLLMLVIGLMMMFNQTQRAFLTAGRQVDILENGRAIMAMVASDLEQMADARNSNVFNFYSEFPAGMPQILQPYRTDRNELHWRSNELQRMYLLTRTNNGWVPIGYAVSNQMGGAGTGIGTLYRYVRTTNERSLDANMFADFFMTTKPLRTAPNDLYYGCNRLLDGVLDFRLRCYDQFGNEYWNNSFPGVNNFPTITNPLPHMVEIELAILDPKVLNQVKALPTAELVKEFLTNKAYCTHVFRQQVRINTAVP